MKLRSSREVNHPQQSLVRLDVYHDAEVSYCLPHTAASDVSSVCHHGVATVTMEFSSTECVQVNMSHGQQKWTYDENIELMQCFYLAKKMGLDIENV